MILPSPPPAAVVSPLPSPVRTFAGVTATVDGRPIAVRATAYNPDRENWSWDPKVADSGLVQFGFRRPSRLTLDWGGDPGDVRVRPERNVAVVRKGGKLHLDVKGVGAWVLEAKGRPPVHVFANPISPAPAAGPGGILRYGPGFHDVSEVKIGKGIRTIWLDPAATIRGRFKVDSAANVTITGGGTIDNGTVKRGEDSGFALFLIASQKLTVDNVTILDNPGWNIVLANCEDVTARNVRILGARATSDGFDVCNSRRVTVTDSFVRNWDDAIAIKGVEGFGMGSSPVEDLTVVRSTFLCDNGWGQPFAVGFETFADRIRRVRIEDCDVLHCTNFLSVHIAEKARLSDFTLRNLRVEMDRPRAFVKAAVGPHKDWNKGAPAGGIESLTLERISVVSPILPASEFTGFSEAANVANVSFREVTLRGRQVAPEVKLGPFVARPEGSS